jgi:mannose-6-phosphate isomerase-like protein (cupin superfamily)
VGWSRRHVGVLGELRHLSRRAAPDAWLVSAGIREVDSQAGAKRNIRDAIQKVAARLGNTPTICRKCYIHPEIITTYIEGSLPLEMKERVEEELREGPRGSASGGSRSAYPAAEPAHPHAQGQAQGKCQGRLTAPTAAWIAPTVAASYCGVPWEPGYGCNVEHSKRYVRPGISMQHEQLQFRKGFRVSAGNKRSQGAVMVLGTGDSEGGPDNRHRGADQWLLVIEGSGACVINGHKLPLKSGMLVLIEAGDTHEIRNTGRGLLKTVSIYVPPAYDADGEELAAGRS